MNDRRASAALLPAGAGPDWRALAAEHGTPLLVLDCDRIRLQYRALARALPDVTLHYAIKALPNADVVTTLADEGCAFDLATNGEVDMVEDLGVDPRRCIHTHPIKAPGDIRRALRYGCTTFVADNVDELDKFAPWRHRIALLLRVSFPNATARVDLSRKFGCAVDDLPALLAAADARGLHVKGLSFHVGSQTDGPDAHVRAIARCAPLFREARPGALAPLSALDIGGGFPANYDGTVIGIEAFCAPLRTALAALPASVRVLAEPGRFIAAPAMTCITAVVGRARRGDHLWYYLDDGVYGSFSGQIYDHTHCPLIPLDRVGEGHPSVLAGPTCDSIDVIAEDVLLPELQIGDLILAPMIGAYSSASATEFNSLPRTPILALHAARRLDRALRLA
ncbi:MAG TPA: type III PLP-dependent enzyme [Pseudomonadales bacterium]|nr:type III PLP-dependent enzyme [Pseudomonadales bacterium]